MITKIKKIELFRKKLEYDDRYHYCSFYYTDTKLTNYYLSDNLQDIIQYKYYYYMESINPDILDIREKVTNNYNLIGEFDSLEEFREHYIEYLI